MELLDYHCFKDLSQEEKEIVEKEAKKIILPSDYILYYEEDICDEVLFFKKW